MSEVNHRLNDLVIEIGRSFLQYVGETWPWTLTQDDDRRKILAQLVDDQSQSVSRLVALLEELGHSVEFGTYPTEYTDKQFLCLEYLQDHMVENQKAVLDIVRSTHESVDCDELTAHLSEILADETKLLAPLEMLSQKPQTIDS